MAKITISEHKRLPNDANGNVVPVFGVGLVQTAPAAPSGSSQVTAAFAAETNFVRVCSDVALHVVTGKTPVATVDNDYYPAGHEIIRHVNVDQGEKLAYLAG